MKKKMQLAVEGVMSEWVMNERSECEDCEEKLGRTEIWWASTKVV